VPQTRIHHLDHAFKLARLHANCRECRDGCLVVARNEQVIGTGTTGMTPITGHSRHDCCCSGHCRSSHAVTRALSACGPRINRAHTLFAVHAPCPDCINLLTSTPIIEIVYAIDDTFDSPSCMLWERAGRTWTCHPYRPQDLKDIDDVDHP